MKENIFLKKQNLLKETKTFVIDDSIQPVITDNEYNDNETFIKNFEEKKDND